jgi:uncharacterized protein YndB with AHSA1/START domain
MTPNDEARDHRSIELEIEVPGTPEQVWEAIATGPGITSWLFPAAVVGREGGAISFDVEAGADMGDDVDASGVVTTWDPPRRFAYEEEYAIAEGEAPATLASEWLVEARAGGTCIVRMVSSGFGRNESWDDELESMRDGWETYLANLRLYLTNFAGQAGSSMTARIAHPGPIERAWAAVIDALGIGKPVPGDRLRASGTAVPPLSGTVVSEGEARSHRWLLMRLDEPAPGTAFVNAFSYRDQVYASLQAYLFGHEAPAVAARDEPAWRAWMDAHVSAG